MNAVTDRPVVLVTGGGRRIGRAISLAFGAAGYNVAVHWHRSGEAAADVAREVAQMGVLSRGFQADLSRPAAAPALAADVRAHFGRVDVLVNNASQFQPTPFIHSSQE